MMNTDSTTGLTSTLQVGVVSWGIRCGSNKYPGVYSRPSGVSAWMEASICELSPDCDGGGFPESSPSPVASPTRATPTISPAPTPIFVSTTGPTSEQSCVCLVEAQCLQDFCSHVGIEAVCEELGCLWQNNTKATPPPNVEGPPAGSNGNGGFQRDGSFDLEKLSFSLMVGLVAASLTFAVLACCCWCRHETLKRPDSSARTHNIQQRDYPSIKRRHTDATEEEDLPVPKTRKPPGTNHQSSRRV